MSKGFIKKLIGKIVIRGDDIYGCIVSEREKISFHFKNMYANLNVNELKDAGI